MVGYTSTCFDDIMYKWPTLVFNNFCNSNCIIRFKIFIC